MRTLTTAALCGLTLALATGRAVADDEPAEIHLPGKDGASAPSPAATPLLYLGLNAHGAEEWYRVIDGAVTVRVPGGPYMKRPYEGWEAEEDPDPVEVASFFVDKHEITNEQFARFLNAGGDTAGLVGTGVPGLVHDDGGWHAAPGLERHPVTAATGAGALAYARWVGGVLPDQLQWEKAAGGAEGRLYPWGDELPDPSRANFATPRAKGSAAVGSFAAGASPYGCLDMAGNVYERVWMPREDGERLPVMIKGGSWLSPSVLNLRVLDMCVQSTRVVDLSVGFRVFMADPDPDRAPRTAATPAGLVLAHSWDEALERARRERKPVFLGLFHETCGQSDRTRTQLLADPRFVAYCNEHMVLVIGHHPYHARDLAHQPLEGGSCPLYPGISCKEHDANYFRGVEIVTDFVTSPGNFVLHPDRCEKGAGAKAILIEERRLPKWGNPVEEYLRAFEEARKLIAEADGK